MKNLFNRFVREEQGQDLIEYGLLVGIITVGAIGAIVLIGPKVTAYFVDVERHSPVARWLRAGQPALNARIGPTYFDVSCTAPA